MTVWQRLRVLTRRRPSHFQTSDEWPRWSDGSPRPRVTTGPTMLELVKGLKPGQQKAVKR